MASKFKISKFLDDFNLLIIFGFTDENFKYFLEEIVGEQKIAYYEKLFSYSITFRGSDNLDYLETYSNILYDENITNELKQKILIETINCPINSFEAQKNFTNFLEEEVNDNSNSVSRNKNEKQKLIKKIKLLFPAEINNKVNKLEQLKADCFNAKYWKNQINTLKDMINKEDSLNIIGKLKEVVESYSKTILKKSKLQIDDKLNFEVLIKKAIDETNIENSLKGKYGESAKNFFVSARTTISKLGAVRNENGAGHGKVPSDFKPLDKDYTNFIVNIVLDFLNYLTLFLDENNFWKH